MPDEHKLDLCKDCGKELPDDKGGSITQWIVSGNKCRCASNTLDDHDNKIELCHSCGKRLTSGRSGSFTQWIFRSDICHCDTSSDTMQETNDFQIVIAPESNEQPIPEDLENFPANQYEAISILGKGASGTVYRALNKSLNKEVAVKTLNVLSEELLVDFQNEARTVSKLSHPNIVDVFDFGVNEKGYPFMAMELIKGISLEVCLKEYGAIDPIDLESIFHQTAIGLEHANNRHVFHRDLKPSNILITRTAGEIQVKVVDFGIALAKRETLTPTKFRGKQLAGTPEYMSPDTANGLIYDSRSEIYSIGCVMYECITGELPFSGDNAFEILSNKSQNKPLPISELKPDLDSNLKLVKVIHKCLETDPENRYQDFSSLLEDLEQSSFEENIEKKAALAPVESKHFRPSNITTVGIALISIVAIVASAGYVIKRLLYLEKPEAIELNKPEPKVETIKVLETFLKHKYKGLTIMVSMMDTTRPVHIEALAKKDKVDGLFIIHDTFSGESLDCLIDKNMKVLCLNDCNISEKGLNNISKLTSLEELYLKGDKLNGGRTSYLASLKNLKELTLSDAGVYDHDLLVLQSLPKLQILYLNDNAISDGALEIISNIPSIKFLSLDNTQITEKGLFKLSKLKKLEHINVLECHNLTASGIAKFKTMRPGCVVATTEKDYIGKYGDDLDLNLKFDPNAKKSLFK